jgi:Domain of unknown function (DUF1917)/Zinc finger, ZZ type
MASDDELQFKAVEDALAGDVSKQFNGHAYIQHIDISCDGCDVEPIIGKRYKCRVCEDRDLCEPCMRALIAARVKMAAEAGADMKAPSAQGSRPKHWISKLKSDNGRVKWGALLQAVPCLHPTHVFTKMDWGPERAVVLNLPSSSEIPSVAPSSSAVREENAEQEEGIPMENLSSLRSRLATQFLSTFPPSGSSCTDVAWIIVDFPHTGKTLLQTGVSNELSNLNITASTSAAAAAPKGATTEEDIEEKIESALEDWESIISKRKPTTEDIGTIAKRHKILCGKWLIFPKTPEEADIAWSTIVHAAARGDLTGCTQVKISPTNPNERGYVICAYTDDYLNEKEVAAAAQALRAALNRSGGGGGYNKNAFKDSRLLYKADVYTYLGIYSKNEWGLKPTIYSSTL